MIERKGERHLRRDLFARPLAVVVALLATACSGTSPEPLPQIGPDLAGAEVLSCDESDQVDPEADVQVLAEGVVVPDQFAVDVTQRSNDLLFAKGGLWARGNANVRLTVISPSDGLVGWGKPSTPARQVVVPSCGGAEWRVWPGGLHIDKPGAISILSETANEKNTVVIAVEAAVVRE